MVRAAGLFFPLMAATMAGPLDATMAVQGRARFFREDGPWRGSRGIVGGGRKALAKRKAAKHRRAQLRAKLRDRR